MPKREPHDNQPATSITATGVASLRRLGVDIDHSSCHLAPVTHIEVPDDDDDDDGDNLLARPVDLLSCSSSATPPPSSSRSNCRRGKGDARPLPQGR
ncbi:hypothetical protein DIS24_g2051 [Lasiodiplodia hormozganensis]|uniref:Uncharacterized protein n=1 Tax=Lasiodiplodia hormozganensis TaxID=869390 RepID=A0AA40D4I8_9PEZI|nr:hypothetical protein DIS24_g2051 [Lasiodiplodia hormozganensis]